MDEQKLRQEHYYYKRKAKWCEFYEQYMDNQSITHINEKAKEFAFGPRPNPLGADIGFERNRSVRISAPW